MRFSFRCECGNSSKLEVDENKLKPRFSPMVMAIRFTHSKGWRAPTKIGKSTVTMVCPKCLGKPLVLDADYLPIDVAPGSYEEDQKP